MIDHGVSWRGRIMKFHDWSFISQLKVDQKIMSTITDPLVILGQGFSNEFGWPRLSSKGAVIINVYRGGGGGGIIHSLLAPVVQWMKDEPPYFFLKLS